MARRGQRASSARRTSLASRTPADETTGGGGGGRGGRARGTASAGRARTTAESSGEVEGDAGPPRASDARQRGKGSKPDAPRSTGRTSGRGSSGAKKSAN